MKTKKDRVDRIASVLERAGDTKDLYTRTFFDPKCAWRANGRKKTWDTGHVVGWFHIPIYSRMTNRNDEAAIEHSPFCVAPSAFSSRFAPRGPSGPEPQEANPADSER